MSDDAPNWYDPDQPAGQMGHSKQWFARIEQHNRLQAEKQAHQDTVALCIFLVAGLVILVACIAWISRYRRRIADVVDNAAVSGIATGMRLRRKIDAKREDVIERARRKTT